MSYGVTSSGALSANVRNAMITLGYKDSGDLLTFDDQEVASHFKPTSTFRGPVYVRGTGHARVADGVLKYKLNRHAPEPVDGSSNSQTVTLLHCVWGWGGYNNGYFKWNSSPNDFDMNSYNTSYETRHNYKPPYSQMQYYKPFIPNK